MMKSDREILESLKPEDLQEQHRMIAEAVGMDGLIRLTDAFGGSSIYVPQKKELVKNRVYGMILEEYDGTNIKELAVRYSVCESTVYNIVRDKIVKGSARYQVEGQMSIADMDIKFHA